MAFQESIKVEHTVLIYIRSQQHSGLPRPSKFPLPSPISHKNPSLLKTKAHKIWHNYVMRLTAKGPGTLQQRLPRQHPGSLLLHMRTVLKRRSERRRFALSHRIPCFRQEHLHWPPQTRDSYENYKNQRKDFSPFHIG